MDILAHVTRTSLLEAYPWLEDLFNWGLLTISGLAFLLALAVYLGRVMG